MKNIRGRMYRRISTGVTSGAAFALKTIWRKDGFSVVVMASDGEGLDVYVRPLTAAARARAAKWGVPR